MYYKKNRQDQHMVFLGRWCPLHRGHIWIIEQKMKENPGMPILILVRDTAFDPINVVIRTKLVEEWMKANKIEGEALIIPDIKGIYFGRGVGYEVEEIKPPKNIQSISATKIREMIDNGNDEWKDIVAPGTQEFLQAVVESGLASKEKAKCCPDIDPLKVRDLDDEKS